MTSRERVLASLNHQQPDKIPIDFDSTPVTGMHVFAVAALRNYYQLKKRLVKAHEPYQMLGLIEPDLQHAIGLDVEGVSPQETLFGFPNQNWKTWRFPNGFEVLVSQYFQTDVEEDGSMVIYPKGDRSAPPSGRIPKTGFFFDTIIRQEYSENKQFSVEDNLEEFGPLSEQDIDYFIKRTKYAVSTGRAVIANFGGTGLGDIALVPAPFLKYPKGIRGIEEWYMATLTRQKDIHQIFEKQTDIALKNLITLSKEVAEYVDVVYICGTDFGTQTSTFCSEQTYRQLYMPYYQKINNWIHQHTNWKTFKHSCGAVGSLIPAMIESGFDILNPVQCSAAGMDARDLKNEYGKDIVFWGGAVDTQKTLAFAKPEDVRREVLERCEIFFRDGGFIFNSVHNVQANTPLKNIVAMIEAVHEFNGDKK